MRGIVLCCLLMIGCSKQTQFVSTDSPTTKSETNDSTALQALCFRHWQSETKRIKEVEVFTTTDPTKWAISAAARTNRMLTMADNSNRETALSISLETDRAFWDSEHPEDLAILEFIDFENAYKAALQVTEERLRVNGATQFSESISAQIKHMESR